LHDLLPTPSADRSTQDVYSNGLALSAQSSVPLLPRYSCTRREARSALSVIYLRGEELREFPSVLEPCSMISDIQGGSYEVFMGAA
jgi:hypothetical protein